MALKNWVFAAVAALALVGAPSGMVSAQDEDPCLEQCMEVERKCLDTCGGDEACEEGCFDATEECEKACSE